MSLLSVDMESIANDSVRFMESIIQSFGKSFLTVVAVLIVYRLFVKSVTPSTVQGWIGL
jgi:hypothetical protein